jgi:sporulation protein YlmC with PRC-barrel domain
MKPVLLATALTLLASTASFAAEPATTSTITRSSDTLMTTMPGDAVTVTNWYKQNVYDSSNNKIGEIEDVLVDKSGKITAVIISVGGFLGMDTKDVAAPFQAIPRHDEGQQVVVDHEHEQGIPSQTYLKFQDWPI